MPKPRENEDKDKFIDRCIPVVIEEGTAEDGSQARAVCETYWERRDMESVYAVTDFVTVRPGEPFRLLPFGKIVKGGQEREITPEFAHLFKLPHFSPAIKLGSHKDETPAGGHIKKLFVGEDGLYALPEFTEKGMKSLEEGDYKYHSPEIVWEGGLEDPKTGETIKGPMIVGDALLHTPHLGEDAALYEYTHKTKEKNVMSETVEVPKQEFWDKVTALFSSSEEMEQAPPELEVDVDKLEAVQSERDEYKAKLDAIEAERKREELMSSIGAEFETDEYGAAYQDMGESEGAVDMLASMDKEQREWVLEKFRALSAQVDVELEEELGTSGEGIDEENPMGQLNALVSERAKADGVTYNEAVKLVRSEQPDLFEKVYGKETG